MKRHIARFRIKGMQMDMNPSVLGAVSEDNPVHVFAYENMNMRINNKDTNDAFSLVNEKGTLGTQIEGLPDGIEGVPIGQNVLNGQYTLFTHGSNDKEISIIWNTRPNIPINYYLKDADIKSAQHDHIYKMWFEDDQLHGTELYNGVLGFNVRKPIETVGYFENEDVAKVYWTDGLNHPRVININAANRIIGNWNNNSFDFVPKLQLRETVSITRNLTGGVFKSGVIQYCFTYFTMYGQQSNIFYTSPQYYTAFKDRGCNVDELPSNSFDFEIRDIDPNFDYVAIYSILRTGHGAEPICRFVGYTAPQDFQETVTKYTRKCRKEDVTYKINGIVYDFTGSDEKIGVTNVYVGSDVLTIPLTYQSYEVHTNLNYNESEGTLTVTLDDGSDERKKQFPFTAKYSKVLFSDNGTQGEDMDIMKLMYIGGEDIVIQTMAEKDNVLFMGNIELKRPYVGNISVNNQPLRNLLKNKIPVDFFVADKDIPMWSTDSFYSYDNQLNYNSSQIKTFKYGETYRFGVQFQYENGKWSEPLWIGDATNDKPVGTSYPSKNIANNYTRLVEAKLSMKGLFGNQVAANAIKALKDNGYKKIRPVVVYPETKDRNILAQGYLCPTVYNFYDRLHDLCYAQSSWFARPVITLRRNDNGGDYIQQHKVEPKNNQGLPENDRFVKGQVGVPLEYRHNYPIPSNICMCSEIQGIKDSISISSVTEDSVDNQYNGYFAIDNSIVTFHSPDVETLEHLDLTDIKLKIIGLVPLTASCGDIQILTETNGLDAIEKLFWHKDRDGSTFYYKKPYIDDKENTITNLSLNGANVLATDIYYRSVLYADNVESGGQTNSNIGVFDYVHPDGEGAPLWKVQQNDSNYNTSAATWDKAEAVLNRNFKNLTGFAVYPWQRTGSLINQGETTENGIKAQLGSKMLANMRYSYNSYYFYKNVSINENLPNPMIYDLNDCQYFDAISSDILKLKVFKKGELTREVYKGIVDNTLTYKESYPFTVIPGFIAETKTNDGPWKTPTWYIKKYNYNHIYPNVYNGYVAYDLYDNDMYAQHLVRVSNMFSDEFQSNSKVADNNTHTSAPIEMRYKSTPHVVMSLAGDSTHHNSILPYFHRSSIYDSSAAKTNKDYFGYGVYPDYGTDDRYFPPAFDYFWGNSNLEDLTKTIEFTGKMSADGTPTNGKGDMIYGFLYLAELYRENITNKFGGIDEGALENNVWVPCGEAVDLDIKNTLVWNEGDTYYQRYDDLKTYPYSYEDKNSIVDIISFMCETRTNIAGRYDRNRGQHDNKAMSPENFNLINKAYSERNDIFVTSYINPDKYIYGLNTFKNQITWTKTKTAGEMIDNWTNITLASTLDLNGENGQLRAIRNFNDFLYTFQDTRVEYIKYNENASIATTLGVPIELANSGKVSGTQQVTNKVGCINKWSICETPSFLTFVDDINKDIYMLSGNTLANLSEKLGMTSYVNRVVKDINIWNPVDFGGIVSYYDKINHDVYFIDKDNCLAYNEVTGTFTSQYSYNNTPYFANINDRGLFINMSRDDSENHTQYETWLYEEGEYNKFFDAYAPYYTKFIVNDNPQYNKIFDILEYRADMFVKPSPTSDYSTYAPNGTYDMLEVKNEYQDSVINLDYAIHSPSPLKKKFRTWRIQIPRDKSRRRDRMQNPWLFVKLGNENHLADIKHVFYDCDVHYFM